MWTKIDQADPVRLAGLLALEASRPGWDDADRRGMLEHFLSCPPTVLGIEGLGGRSLSSLFDGSASLELLTRAKNALKRAASEPDEESEREVASLLYYAAIAAAAVHHGARITAMSDAQLAAGIDQCLSLHWLNRETSQLLQAQRKRLRP